MPGAREVDKQTIEQAIDAFKDHQLVLDDRENGRWRIARRDENGRLYNEYLTEIISLWGGRLFVGGDIDDCVFAYCSSNKDMGIPEFHMFKVAWMGHCNDVSYYVRQKASIGLSDNGKLTGAWNREVALDQLWGMLADMELEESPSADGDRNTLHEAIKMVDGGSGSYDVWNCIYSGYREPNDVPTDLGMVTSPRVIYAWAACRRLCELILD